MADLFATEKKTIDLPRQTIMGVCPSKSNCYSIGFPKGKGGAMDSKRPFLFKMKALTDYENKFYIQCNHYRNTMIQGYFEFHMDVFYPSERADLDNSLKVVLDCLQKKCKAIENDNKCTLLVVRKFVDKLNPRIEFFIRKV